MDCVNHPGKPVTAYCQNCGKPLCAECVTAGVLRQASRGMILCQECIDAWQTANPYVPPAPGTPIPSLAAILGLIPGVGAMYNGQFIKGLIHVGIFAVLISAANLYGIFGLFIAAWIFYQAFEAYYTARAKRDGTPLPDPLGLNEVGNWLNVGGGWMNGGRPAAPHFSPNPQQAAQSGPASQQAPFVPPVPPPAAEAYVPPVPQPPPPVGWKRKEPIGAIVLIVIGVLFLLGQLDILSGRILEYAWPVLLIVLGLWMMIRRLTDSQGR